MEARAEGLQSSRLRPWVQDAARPRLPRGGLLAVRLSSACCALQRPVALLPASLLLACRPPPSLQPPDPPPPELLVLDQHVATLRRPPVIPFAP
eukprot:scaffold314091_cov30-Tisochrysis_lutea.AAC.1